jgi:phosphatidylserine/phosphatidylglycerophosphate/cardiolipin synthase-like enzyme
MAIELSVHTNGDDAFLAWAAPTTDDWLGFALYREVYRADGSVQEAGYLPNYVGFESDDPQPGESRPSTEWPIQRYTWTDHGVDAGTSVAYWIAPVAVVDGFLEVVEDEEVGYGPVDVSTGSPSGHAYFNRGFVLSQFIARSLPAGYEAMSWTQKRAALKNFRDDLSASDSKLRDFLSGQLGDALVELLTRVRNDPDLEVHAALYELSDQLLVDALAALGARAHVVLANGSTKNSRKPEIPKPYDDGNAAAATRLVAASVDLIRRMCLSGPLAHNKFLVVSRNGTPEEVWTGSTNWATTGLCTQVNNALHSTDPALAAVFRHQWDLLEADSVTDPTYDPDPDFRIATFGPALMAANNTAHDVAAPAAGGRSSRVWFSRTTGAPEMADLVRLVEDAREAVFFLMFEPGSSVLLKALVDAAGTDVLVHGVVNTLRDQNPDTPEGADSVSVTLVSRGDFRAPFKLDIVQPEGVEKGLGQWAAEVARNDFLSQNGGIGHAIIHSKLLVIDPFTNPVVVTGSHNFSVSATTKNDENVVVLRGDPQLAERYAVHVMGAYQHYRWRAYLRDCERRGVSPWQSLDPDPSSWQGKNTDAGRAETGVWLSGV